MNLERYKVRGKAWRNDFMAEGLLFEYCDVGLCIAVDPLSANDYGELYDSHYVVIDPDTIEPIAVQVEQYDPATDTALCPNCRTLEGRNEGAQYCRYCGQRLSWDECKWAPTIADAP